MNVEKATLDKILANEEIRSPFYSDGTGFGGDFDLSKARYQKLVIVTDADVDGSPHSYIAHYLSIIVICAPQWKLGYIYIAQPPLYKIETR